MVAVDQGSAAKTAMLEIERAATTLDVADIASYLQKALGQRFVAYLAGLHDPKMVGQWAGRRHLPRDWATEMRLRTGYQASRLLVDAFDTRTALAWLFGSNSHLNGEAPAYVIRHAQTPDDLRRVVPAAYAFTAAS